VATPLAKPRKKYIPKVKYINNEDGKGWLTVKHHPRLPGSLETYPPLPQFLKVKTYKEEGGREYFEILEGKLRTKKASTPLRSSNSRLNTAIIHRGKGVIRFDRENDKLWFGNEGPISAFTDIKPGSNDPLIPLGTWALQIPYELHKGGAGFMADSRFAKTWFRIITPNGDVNDRYLHPGTESWGCATVDDTKWWTDIYYYLIDRRDRNGTVGTIEVFDGVTTP